VCARARVPEKKGEKNVKLNDRLVLLLSGGVGLL